MFDYKDNHIWNTFFDTPDYSLLTGGQLPVGLIDEYLAKVPTAHNH